MTAPTTQKKTLSGTVISTKMHGTVVVSVERYEKHPRYGKYIRSRKRFKVHAAEGACKEGDQVTIVSCRPISKDKHFRLLKVTSHQSPVTSTDSETGNGALGTGHSNI